MVVNIYLITYQWFMYLWKTVVGPFACHLHAIGKGISIAMQIHAD
jgi:hypothetical protein